MRLQLCDWPSIGLVSSILSKWTRFLNHLLVTVLDFNKGETSQVLSFASDFFFFFLNDKLFRSFDFGLSFCGVYGSSY